MSTVLCLHGPNLNQLGRRQPEVYGSTTLPELEAAVNDWGRTLGFEVRCLQSNHEGELVEAIHEARDDAGVIFNPGALTHSSRALQDAVAAIDSPVVEVHLSNIRKRERWRRRSFLAPVAAASIFGRGPIGYRDGLRHLANRAAFPIETVRYGPHPDQVMDLRRGEASTGVILVHGGFWRDEWGRDTTESWAVDLARRGVPSANLEYRRLDSGGGAAATVSDVARAMEEATDHLGTDSIVAVGHSVGSQLVLAAMAEGFHAAVSAFISVGGVLDLEGAERDGIGDGAIEAFDPGWSLSPLGLPPPRCPVVLMHGGADDLVPDIQSRRYADYLTHHQVEHLLGVLEEVGHFDALKASSPAWTGALDALGRLGRPLGQT
ncbi:MAG TPA: type II 3-dehydroquinate dehydratase [Acidimicrobiia bacterium]|nr:type II 3-dehydroquinate dehydratase [Acidimicrobiia bacterium]